METTRVALPLPVEELPLPPAPIIPASPSDCQIFNPAYLWYEDREQTVSQPSSANGLEISWQTSVVAGVALALTSGAIATLSQPGPTYQGQFELMMAPADASSSLPLPAPTVETGHPTVERSATDLHTQLEILESPLLLAPVVEQLHRRQIHLDYDDLVAGLSIDPLDPGLVMVRFRHTSPDIAQVVVEELAESYLAYGETCRLEACRGLRYVESQVPLIQERIQTTQTHLEQLQKYLGTANVEGQARVLTAWRTELGRQQIDLEGRLAAARQQYHTLLEELAMQGLPQPASASDDSPVPAILEQNPQYQLLLRQLQTLDPQLLYQQLAAEYGSLQSAAPPLEALREQHTATLRQLQQAVQAIPGASELPSDPVAAADEQPSLPAEQMAEAIATAHQIQVLEIRQQSIQHIGAGLNRQIHHLATLLRQQEKLQQDLAANSRILADYGERRTALQSQFAQEYVTWQTVAPPTLVTDADGQPQPLAPSSLPGTLGIGAGIGVMVGLVVSNRLEQSQNLAVRQVGRMS